MTVEKLKGYEPFFGVWTVDSKIAEGRFSKVFKVSRIEDGKVRHQCLKTIRFPAGNEELSRVISSGIYQNVQQYLDEVEKSVRLNMEKMLMLRDNKNIVRFDNYQIIKESSCFYLVILTELLRPLSDYLKVDSATQNDVIRIGADLCCALEGFREVGIIHHEVKPENVYVDKYGNFKLGDFGVCKGRFGEDKITSSYIAPELYTKAPIDISSDIYSLGILIYKLLNNNRLPFLPPYPAPVSMEDRETAFARRMRGDLLPAPSNATQQLAGVIYKATAYRAHERYLDPAIFAASLESNYLYEPPAQAEPEVYAPPVPIKPVAPKPINPYHLQSEDTPLHAKRAHIRNEASEDEREDFAEAFAEDEEDIQEGEKVNKKWYFIIIGLVIVLAVAIGLVAKGGSDKKETTTTTTTSAITFGEQTTGPTTSTTTATTTTATPTTTTTTPAPTTTKPSPVTVGTTTMAGTSQAISNTTTPLPTTQQTTAPSEEPTVPGYTEPNFVYSPNVEGSTDTQGRVYTSVNLSVATGFGNGKDVTIKMEGLEGSSPKFNEGYVTVYIMSDARVMGTSTADATLVSGSDGSISCFLKVNDEYFNFDPETYQYFVLFEDGAVSTDKAISLGAQVRVNS